MCTIQIVCDRYGYRMWCMYVCDRYGYVWIWRYPYLSHTYMHHTHTYPYLSRTYTHLDRAHQSRTFSFIRQYTYIKFHIQSYIRHCAHESRMYVYANVQAFVYVHTNEEAFCAHTNEEALLCTWIAYVCIHYHCALKHTFVCTWIAYACIHQRSFFFCHRRFPFIFEYTHVRIHIHA